VQLGTLYLRCDDQASARLHFRQAFTEAAATGASEPMLKALAGYAELLVKENKISRAAEFLSFARHRADNPELKERISRQVEGLPLTPEALKVAIEVGAAQSLEQIAF